MNMLTLVILSALIAVVKSACTTAGDPFINTFDGARLEFQGRCHYNLASFEDPDNSGFLQKFSVYTQHARPPQDESRAYTQRVHVNAHDHTISLHDNGRILIDNEEMTTAVSAEGDKGFAIESTYSISVYKIGPMVKVVVAGAVEVTFDARTPTGRHVATVEVLNDGYRGHLTGMCGNNNGNEQDDHIPRGETMAGTATEIGNSNIINGPECL